MSSEAVHLFMGESLSQDDSEHLNSRWAGFTKAQQATLSKIAQDFAVNPLLLLGDTRGKKPVATARQVAIYALFNVHQLQQTEIAELFHRDASTVGYAIRVIKKISEGHEALVRRYFARFQNELDHEPSEEDLI